MLEICVFNVGDGDSILLREHREGKPDFTVLVDCGRPCLEFVKGSKRQETVYHLKRERIDHIDIMLLTHLHIDHIGGALNVLRHFPVHKLMALYLPPAQKQWITPPQDSEDKAIVGLCHMLNLFSDIVDEAARLGVVAERAQAGKVELTERLGVAVYLPDAKLTARQKMLFDALYHNEHSNREKWHNISKERNCSSVITCFDYAGRSVLLTGDSYASYWDRPDISHVDVLKLPHHGDGKSITEPLIKKLTPEYAIISCQNDTSSKKDRPCAAVVELLQKYAGTLICTENRPLPMLKASVHDCVRLFIAQNGTITFATY